MIQKKCFCDRCKKEVNSEQDLIKIALYVNNQHHLNSRCVSLYKEIDCCVTHKPLKSAEFISLKGTIKKGL